MCGEKEKGEHRVSCEEMGWGGVGVSGVEPTRKRSGGPPRAPGRPWELLPPPWPCTQVALRTPFLFVGSSLPGCHFDACILKWHLDVCDVRSNF